jgi:sugar lactone lactonase YvrE
VPLIPPETSSLPTGITARSEIDIAADKATTYLSGLNLPVAVAIDAANNLYVVSEGEGTIRKFDSFGNPIATVSGLSAPTAIALDGTTNIYVTELGGAVKRISPAGNVTSLVNGFNQPRGVAVMDSGAIAVSETTLSG